MSSSLPLAIAIHLISLLQTAFVHLLNTWPHDNILIISLILKIKSNIIATQSIDSFLNNSITLILFIILRTELKVASWYAHIPIGRSNIIYTLIICKGALIYLMINLLGIVTRMNDLDTRRIRGCTSIRDLGESRHEIMKVYNLHLINSFLLGNIRSFMRTRWIITIENYILIILTIDLTFPSCVLTAKLLIICLVHHKLIHLNILALNTTYILNTSLISNIFLVFYDFLHLHFVTNYWRRLGCMLHIINAIIRKRWFIYQHNLALIYRTLILNKIRIIMINIDPIVFRTPRHFTISLWINTICPLLFSYCEIILGPTLPH